MAIPKSSRQVFTGNWTCSECGKEIKELPFQPRGSRVRCNECWKSARK